jgi:hypothetical protein
MITYDDYLRLSGRYALLFRVFDGPEPTKTFFIKMSRLVVTWKWCEVGPSFEVLFLDRAAIEPVRTTMVGGS